MSNGIVGSTYQAIIAKVIEASENDFLENGVDQALLDELRTGWQKRLTDLKGAHYPWDPAPAIPQNPPTVPSNVPKTDPSPIPSSAPVPQQNQNYGNVRIKQEIKEEGGYGNGQQYVPPPQPAYSSGLDRGMAAQRAATLLQRDFGPQAAQSIAALPQQNNITLPGQQQRPTHIQLPPNGQPQRPPPQQMAQHRPHQGNIYQTQTDGADDSPSEEWSEHVASVHAQGQQGQLAADGFVRQQVQALAERMDSGLLIPLDELPASRRSQLKKAARLHARSAAAAEASSSGVPRIPQLDGDDSDEDKIADDEAINSDLDDSEDEIGDGDEDTLDIGDTMLCTYDKVQRVKNKWKCTLKDGILTTNGKDYLFHKATGEFEW